MTAQPNRIESSDGYMAIVARLDPDCRVIECRTGLQWIGQKRTQRHGETEWSSRAYCRTRKALIASSMDHAPFMTATAEASLHRLPERIGGRI